MILSVENGKPNTAAADSQVLDAMGKTETSQARPIGKHGLRLERRHEVRVTSLQPLHAFPFI